ncbi:MAG: hypothetical protein ACR2PX_28800 [Endozoicomonas sp.]
MFFDDLSLTADPTMAWQYDATLLDATLDHNMHRIIRSWVNWKHL